MKEYDGPTAVLMGVDGYERVVSVREPAPHTIEVPIPRRVSIHDYDQTPQVVCVPVRVFRLSRHHRRADHMWWRVYNEGRSRTPEKAYVYFELAAERPQETP